ncbi:beach-domain-containing protein [Piedraia hortae CBS 480.64]|uniref:Beach-domain-containing protein n=1 Tax=Piedraia hortae CBS 480.64 TaxID=1314780 RepID=A0A6A7BR46_9PEZI|nr:beach-domain-containing protein [Piedraia hortae CBS 480.64]
MFRRGRGFEKAVQLLKELQPCLKSNESRMMPLALLAKALLRLLGNAVGCQNGNERYFAEVVDGWATIERSLKDFLDLILGLDAVSDGKEAVSQVFKGLFGLAAELDSRVEGVAEVELETGTLQIQHAHVVLVAVRLSFWLVSHRWREHYVENAVQVIHTTTRLVKSSTHNKWELWRLGLLSPTLRLAFDPNAPEPAKMAASELVLASADFGFAELEDVAFLFKQACELDSAREMLLTTMVKSKGPAFVQFDLTKSGFASIEFPGLLQAFPPSNGYTWSAWVRIDEFDSKTHTTLFGAFDKNQTCFILIYLEKDSHQIILQTSVRAAKPSVRFRSSKLQAGQWYHIALVHSKVGTDPQQSPALLYLNGEISEKLNCTYPQSPAAPSPVQAFFGTPRDLAFSLGRNKIRSRWSLAGVRIYNVAITDEFVALQHQLGPRYYGNLQDFMGPYLTYHASAELHRWSELLHPDKNYKMEKSDIAKAVNSLASEVVPENRLLLSIHPYSVMSLADGSDDSVLTAKIELNARALTRMHQLARNARWIVVNCAIPKVEEAITQTNGVGIATGDPVVVIPQSLDDSTWRLAGTLPLMIRLLESCYTKDAFILSTKIYFESFMNNWRVSEAMERGSGFGLYAMILSEKLGFDTFPSSTVAARKPCTVLSLEDCRTLPSQLLPLILGYMGYDATHPEQSMIINPLAYRVLFLDFDTWRRCEISVQKLYYTQFVHFLAHNRHQIFNQKRLSRMRLVKRLIDVLKAEEVSAELIGTLMEALRAMLDNHQAYRELAMFVVYGLQDERVLANRSLGMVGVVDIRQRAASWAARYARSSRRNTEAGPVTPTNKLPVGLSRAGLAMHALRLLKDLVCDNRSSIGVRRLVRAVPIRWLFHLSAEDNASVVGLTLHIISRMLSTAGSEFNNAFADKHGFVFLQSRLKAFWTAPDIWVSCFAILFGRTAPEFTEGQSLVDIFNPSEELSVAQEGIMPAIFDMLEAGLKAATENPEHSTPILHSAIQLLRELYARCPAFRKFATRSDGAYIQHLLFVLYPVLIRSDRITAEMELENERRPEKAVRPGTSSEQRISSYVMVPPAATSTHFRPVLALKQHIQIRTSNGLVENLLQVAIDVFIDMVCRKDKFQGIGLFHKVPPGPRELQACFETFLFCQLLHALSAYLKQNQNLFLQTNILQNLARFSSYMSEAVFEGWFLDGAQEVLEFTGQILECLQQPHVAEDKTVRLCSQHTGRIRIVFLQLTIWRLSRLETEDTNGAETAQFLRRMDYWQTILFATENQEALFMRLICFQLYLKLVSPNQTVCYAAARLWRTILVHKPTVSATVLTQAVGLEHRHLSTGFMKLISMEDEEFIHWVDENRTTLDSAFFKSFNKPWDDWVNDENRANEHSANARIEKRRERLRAWHIEEMKEDDQLHRFEIATSHWRLNVHGQERVKLQRAYQDHQENVNYLYSAFAKLEKALEQPGGIEPPKGPIKWQLDETEAVNRMRVRLIPDKGDKDMFQPRRKGSALSSINGTPSKNARVAAGSVASLSPREDVFLKEDVAAVRERANSATNPQLLEGGFEIVDDPNEVGDSEDKNRTILTRLQRGDQVKSLCNVSRIVGLEACEGLLVVGKKCLYLQDGYFQRSDGEIVGTSQAPEDERDPYVQLISGKDVGQMKTVDEETRFWTWPEVLSISKRRFLFRDVSVEVFFTDGRSYLLICISPAKRDALYNEIVAQAPHVHSTTAVAGENSWRLDTLRNPEEMPQSLGTRFATVFSSTPQYAATKKWVRGEMSNFQYLMLINTVAGRTFNDLTQYPIFPWVLADYTSEELDLANPASFRNLAKPMGCQTPSREAEFRDRYQQFADMGDENAPPFHYGTHYSSAMIVSSFLIRLPPFVQSYLLLQGGSFDHADRLFDSVGKAWLSASRDNMSDVRELTPEFFYLPEFLTNINRYDFGIKQGDGGRVNDVALPPWAKGDAQIFIQKHREALESRYVSEHLHEWIDLIFGYKQRGEAAIEATNVFNHLSYNGAKDLDAISDQVERLATIGIIHSFGQTPHQVFQRPHPNWDITKLNLTRLDCLAESLIRIPNPLFTLPHPITNLTMPQGRLICDSPTKLHLPLHPSRYLQFGFSDHSIRFFSTNTARLLGIHENLHIGPILAATFADSKTLILSGGDCTLSLWNLSLSRDIIELQAKTYLFAHRKPVVILTSSRVFSTLLSISTDGQAILWDLNRYEAFRLLLPAGAKPSQSARISNVTGRIVLAQGRDLVLYAPNGTLLLRQRVEEGITALAFYEGSGNEYTSRELVFSGHESGAVCVWAIRVLGDGAWCAVLVKKLDCGARVRSLLTTPTGVFAGDEEGGVGGWECVAKF